MSLEGKVAFVSGAARGIGRGCAIELARAGADVVINDLGRSDEAAGTVAEIESLGRRSVLVEGDVFQRASCEQIAQRAVSALGGIDILVSNPAFSRRAPFLQLAPEIFERTIQCTLTSAFHMSQLVARHMVETARHGKIVFISSLHARIPYVDAVAYNAANTGLIAMAKTIAAELLPHRINVNVIEPGWIDTPGEREVFGAEAMAQTARELPWGRLGTPEEIGRAAVFLVSPNADYITGSSLLVDGGLWLRCTQPLTRPSANQGDIE